MGCLTAIHVSYFRVFQMSAIPRVFWPTALKLGWITNFDMLFLVMEFISLVDEIQFMLISSRHICIRSILELVQYNTTETPWTRNVYAKHENNILIKAA